MRRHLLTEPAATDFVPAAEYEAEAPAAYGLPETPVLYETVRTSDLSLWVASEGVYVWWFGNPTKSAIHDLNAVRATRESVYVGDEVLPLDAGATRRVANAVERCSRVFGTDAADDVEFAIPVDIETGQADDLGDERLLHNIGTDHGQRTGPPVAEKRRRSS